MKYVVLFFLITQAHTSAIRAGDVSVSRQIDMLIEKDLAANKLKANPPAGDGVFVRRIYLDVIGRIPTFRETEEFLASAKPDKRSVLIDKLLASEGYVSHFFNYWSDILRNHSPRLGGTLSTGYTLYLKDSLRTNKPYDQFVREMLTAQGKGWENGAVGYYLRDFGMPLDNMANTVRIFLGTRIECAQCHDHPFDNWKQMQFYQMAAFTNGVDGSDYNAGPVSAMVLKIRAEDATLKRSSAKASPEDAAANKQRIRENQFTRSAIGTAWAPLYFASTGYKESPLRLPHDYRYDDAKPKDVVKPATMMGKPLTLAPDAPPLVDFANWLTSRENPRFTRVIANRLWKKVFGLGLFEPVDEIVPDTKPVNPELMEHLERTMVAMKYDMRAFLRALLNTRAYQSEATREEIAPGAAYHFTGPVLRRMSAEQIWDSIGTLINPTPDVPNIEKRHDMQRRMLVAKKLSDAIEALPSDEREQRFKAAGARLGTTAEKLVAIQKEIVIARAQKDKEKVDALMKKTEPYRLNAQQSVNEEVLLPALAKLNQKVTGDAAPPKLDKPLTDPITLIAIPGYELPRANPEQAEVLREARERALDMASYYGVPEKDKVYFPGICASAARTWPRASDVGSPSPDGHYLRAFGQSDREVIENAASDASIPQTLIFMNSEILPQIMSPKSQLSLSISKANGTDQQLENAYLAMLSRKPTADEKRQWSTAQSRGLDSMEDLVFALINTQQFIFVQ
jgi:hypothetical protein